MLFLVASAKIVFNINTELFNFYALYIRISNLSFFFSFRQNFIGYLCCCLHSIATIDGCQVTNAH